MKRKLVLEDGSVFEGEGFGSGSEAFGEVVFTTSMTGYQELLTDPSFLGQMAVMTFPMQGNYGINRYDYESSKPHVSAMIVGEYAEHPSNFRMEKTLSQYLAKFGIPGLCGIDTRKLTRLLREKGSLKGIITDSDVSNEEALMKIGKADFFINHIERVSAGNIYEVPGSGKRVVLYDYGMKSSILKNLAERGLNITVVPWNYPAEDALELNPDGIMLSNGPGNPDDVPETYEIIKKLLGKVPVFGICMGHQLLAKACGAETERMVFGHRGGNNPVKELETGKIYITSQNHGYVVDEESLSGTGLEVTYRCVNDGTVEGIRHRKYNAFSVQFHPESSPGPSDGSVIFEKFLEMMEGKKNAAE